MYFPSKYRYENMEYRHSGSSGLKLPAISLGLWHNAGDKADMGNLKDMILTAFDLGITHFDLANNYGPPPGSAEINFGKILNTELHDYRDELIISTKAGYEMWDGPYGDGGSRKYLIASLNQSLKRMNTDYVDIFYHHRMDPSTPLEETMLALADIVRSGKALYVGLSNYNGEVMEKASAILDELKCPFIINQNRYSVFDRELENRGVLESVKKLKKGLIIFSPLAQGLLSERYLNGIPNDSRVRTDGRFLKEERITRDVVDKIRKLNDIASLRGQSLSSMAISWLLSKKSVTSVLIGASKSQQIKDNVTALDNTYFTADEYEIIDRISLN